MINIDEPLRGFTIQSYEALTKWDGYTDNIVI